MGDSGHVATVLWAVLIDYITSDMTGRRSAHRTDSSCGEPVATAFRKLSNIQKHSRLPAAVRLRDDEIMKRHCFHIRALMMPFRIERFALSRCLYEIHFISVVDLHFSYAQQQTLGVFEKDQLLQEIEQQHVELIV